MLSTISEMLSDLSPNVQLAVRCVINMLIGGALALYVRELYKRYATTVSNRESFANVFPMLILTTVVIIFIVKSSLALSLGLVGALSIVRFRAAIKSPEELVYLFFCIGIGLALGAEHRALTLVAVFIVSIFIIGRGFLGKKSERHNLLLTVSGESGRFFDTGESSVVELLTNLAKGLTIQRFDLEDGQVQFRATVSFKTTEETTAFMSKIQDKLPQFQVSYVNLDTLL